MAWAEASNNVLDREEDSPAYPFIGNVVPPLSDVDLRESGFAALVLNEHGRSCSGI